MSKRLFLLAALLFASAVRANINYAVCSSTNPSTGGCVGTGCSSYNNVGLGGCGCSNGACAIFAQSGNTVTYSVWIGTSCTGSAIAIIPNIPLNGSCTTAGGGSNALGISATSSARSVSAVLALIFAAVASAGTFAEMHTHASALTDRPSHASVSRPLLVRNVSPSL